MARSRALFVTTLVLAGASRACELTCKILARARDHRRCRSAAPYAETTFHTTHAHSLPLPAPRAAGGLVSARALQEAAAAVADEDRSGLSGASGGVIAPPPPPLMIADAPGAAGGLPVDPDTQAAPSSAAAGADSPTREPSDPNSQQPRPDGGNSPTEPGPAAPTDPIAQSGTSAPGGGPLAPVAGGGNGTAPGAQDEGPISIGDEIDESGPTQEDAPPGSDGNGTSGDAPGSQDGGGESEGDGAGGGDGDGDGGDSSGDEGSSGVRSLLSAGYMFDVSLEWAALMHF
jgi:hypothetical protein